MDVQNFVKIKRKALRKAFYFNLQEVSKSPTYCVPMFFTESVTSKYNVTLIPLALLYIPVLTVNFYSSSCTDNNCEKSLSDVTSSGRERVFLQGERQQ